MAKNNKYFSNLEPSTANDSRTIPSTLKPTEYLNDQFMSSVGLYSNNELEKARFSKYSRFGRPLDPYGKLNDCREYLFFVKPDLHIAVPAKEVGIVDEVVNIQTDNGRRKKTRMKVAKSESVYNLGLSSGGSLYSKSLDTYNNLTLNPQLDNNSYFRELITSHPNVIRQLQRSAPGTDNFSTVDPFCHLLSFSVNSYLEMPGSEASTLDNPSTIFGTSYEYLKDAEEADENPSFSLEFLDNKYLDTYHFFKAYTEYHIARKSGLVTPPSRDYYRYKRLHNTMGIYKFIVAEDMETIIYYAYFWGVFPTSCPRETFSDPLFNDGLTFSVSFKSAFMEDMNPIILKQFNKLMGNVIDAYGINKEVWLPVVRQNAFSQELYASKIGQLPTKVGDNSYDTASLGTPNILNGMYPTSMIDGELPVAALVDGRQFSTNQLSVNADRPKYKLRWYGIPKETQVNG